MIAGVFRSSPDICPWDIFITMLRRTQDYSWRTLLPSSFPLQLCCPGEGIVEKKTLEAVPWVNCSPPNPNQLWSVGLTTLHGNKMYHLTQDISRNTLSNKAVTILRDNESLVVCLIGMAICCNLEYVLYFIVSKITYTYTNIYYIYIWNHINNYYVS